MLDKQKLVEIFIIKPEILKSHRPFVPVTERINSYICWSSGIITKKYPMEQISALHILLKLLTYNGDKNVQIFPAFAPSQFKPRLKATISYYEICSFIYGNLPDFKRLLIPSHLKKRKIKEVIELIPGNFPIPI